MAMSLKKILATTFLFNFSRLIKADYGSGNGYGDGYGNQGNQAGTYNGGSNSGDYSSTDGYSSTNSYSSTNGYSSTDGFGNGWGQTTDIATATALVQTVAVTMTETMMATTTVTESCTSSQQGMMPYSSISPGGPPMFSPPGAVSIQVVHVSDNNGSLAYSPESIVATPGSLVEFIFYPKNHTVTQSSFAAPCVPIGVSTPNATTPEAPGIKSGFVPVAANSTDFIAGVRPSFTIMVNDTKPIWLYCGQPGHCQKGMAMVINQNMSDTVKTLDNYKLAAAQVPVPGGDMSAGPPGGAYSSAEPSTSTSTFTATFPPPAATSSAEAAPPPAIAITTSSSVPIASVTTSAPGIATFTGAAVNAKAQNMGTAIGVFAMGAMALL